MSVVRPNLDMPTHASMLECLVEEGTYPTVGSVHPYWRFHALAWMRRILYDYTMHTYSGKGSLENHASRIAQPCHLFEAKINTECLFETRNPV